MAIHQRRGVGICHLSIIGLVLSLLTCSQWLNKDDSDSEDRNDQLIALLLSQPECQRNSTATVYFINSSNTSTTYDVIWDGSKWATVAPGNRTQTFTFGSGQHTLLFRVTNTTNTACAQSTPNLGTCGNYWYSCSN